MRKVIVLFLGAFGLIVSTVMGQGAAPTSPSPFKWNGNYIENVVKTTTGLQIILTNSAGKDTLDLYRVGSLTYMIGPSLSVQVREVRADSIRVTNGGWFTLGGSRFTSLLGTRMRNNGGLLEPYFTSNPILYNEVDLTGGNIVLSGYKSTTAVADSALASLYTAKYAIGSKRLSATAPTDQYVATYDAGKDSVIWQAAPGSAGGNTTKIDTANASGSSNVWTKTTQVIYFPGATYQALGASKDTLVITTAAANSVLKTGASAGYITSGATFNWNNAKFDSLRYIDVDSIHLDTNSGSIVLADSVKLNGFGMRAYNSNDLYVTGASGKNVFVGQTSTGTNGALFLGDNTNSTGYQVKGDTLMQGYGSSSVAKMVLKGIKFARIDSLRLAQFTTRPFLGDSTKSDSGLTTVKNVRDTINNYLSGYVAKPNENWQDIGATGHIWGLPDATTNDTALTIQRFVSPSTWTRISPDISTGGPLTISSPAAESLLATTYMYLGGASGSTQFKSNVNHNGMNIDSVGTLTSDYAIGKQMIAAKNAGGFLFGFTAPSVGAGGTASRAWTLPTVDGSSGWVLSTNGAGGLSFVAPSGGSGTGGYPFSVIDTLPAHRADSMVVVAGSGTLPVLTKTANTDTLKINLQNILPSMFINADSIATNKELADTSLYNLQHTNPWWNKLTTATGTLYGGFTGADSIFTKDKNGVPSLVIRSGHTGSVDTLQLGISSGYEYLQLGNGGTGSRTVMDAETLHVNNNVVFIGAVKYPITDGTANQVLKTNGSGVASWATVSGGGGGTFTQIGSMTTDPAFANSGADADWIGMGATAGRILFDVNGSGNNDDAVQIPTGRLIVGKDSTAGGLNAMIAMRRDTNTVVYTSLSNKDSTNTNSQLYLKLDGPGKSGGDMGVILGAASTQYTIGVDQPSDAFKIVVGTNFASGGIFSCDSGGTSIVVGGTSGGTAYHYTATADSAFATVGAKRYTTWPATAGDIYWQYSSATALDTANKAYFPYMTKGLDTTYLFYDSSNSSSTVSPEWSIGFRMRDTSYVDTLFITYSTTDGTTTHAKIDSVGFNWTKGGISGGATITKITGVAAQATDLASATPALVGIPIGAINQTIPAGATLKAHFYGVFGGKYALRIYDATVVGRVRH